MKKLLTLIVMLVTSMTIYAVPVKYINCIPETGASISSFDFTLNFDITEAVESLGAGDWGLGYLGNLTNDTFTTLYEGSPENGVELGKVLTENFTGKSEGFSVNSSSVNISFPLTLKPEFGKTYTLVIKNTFSIFQLGKPAAKSATSLKFQTDPLVLTFVGGMPSSSELLLQDVSIEDGVRLNTLKEVLFSFNEDITITDNAKVSILEGSQTIYESLDISVAADNAKVLWCKFADDIELYNAHNYKLALPAGTVSLATDNSVVNKEHLVNIVGGAYKHYSVKSTSPEDGTIGLFNSVQISYNIPTGTRIFEEGIYWDKSLKIYKEAISEANLITTLYGTATSDNIGIKWDLKTFPLEPSTHYILYRAEGLGKLFSDTENLSEWTNEESIIHVSTPSIEESGFPPIELGDPVIGKHDGGGRVLKNGDYIDALDLIEIAPVDYFYKDNNGNTYYLSNDTNNHTGYLYDITSGSPELIKEVSLSRVKRETSTFYYGVISAPIKSVFFEGHTYRFVIPKGEFTILNPPLYNYIRTPEYSIEFKGSSPSEVNLLNCSLQEGEERSALGNVVWTFKGQFELNPEAEAILSRNKTQYKWLLTSSHNNGNTRVVAHIYDDFTGEPLGLSKDNVYTVTLPEGAVYYQADPTIKNKEIAISFKGIDAKPDVHEPEFVNLSVSINGIHSTTLEALKDREATINIVSDDNWKVTSLKRDGNDVLGFLEPNGVYTTPGLQADTRVEAAVEYAGLIVNDNPLSEVQIESDNIKIYSEGDHIIVDGLKQGDNIAIYTTSGLTVCDRRVESSDVTSMSFFVRNNEVYIVRVNDKAAKIQH